MKMPFRLKKLNNAGVSLVELLVAIVILAVVSAPFLHSYLTSANTNAKARKTMDAAAIAEDAMEEMEAYTVSELLSMTMADGSPAFTKTDNPTGNDFTLTTDGEHYESSASGYTVEIKLDPDSKTEYTDFNSLNVSDVLTIKADACGLFAMLPEADNSAYNVFVARNLAVSGDTGFALVDRDYFKNYLTREIVVTFTTRGPIAVIIDGVDTTIRHVAVSVDITYKLPDARKRNGAGQKVLDTASDCVYTVHKDVYDNASSKVPFESVYILYTPRFNDMTNKDVIRIVNRSNIEGTCLVIRQKTDADDAAGPYNYSNYKAEIILEEDPAWGPGTTDITNKKAALELRTNLFSSVSTTGLKFEPVYKTLSATFGSAYDLDKRLKTMGYRTADGRSFFGTPGKARIYSVTVTVKKGTETLATLTGTKTE